MKRIVAGIVLSGSLVIACLAFGQADPGKATGTTEVKGTEYHHLLTLDLREAAEHARTLNHYARYHAAHLEKAVVMRHVEELAKNLDGIQAGITDVEQHGTHAAAADPQLSLIRKHDEQALRDLAILRAEVDKDQLDANVIQAKSLAIHNAMTQARETHHRVMTKNGVREPMGPLSKK